ncbi:BMP family protein [Cellulosilyticum sp. I15G10I2]|uniref:BMP family protein n=1 Tax=Cellulosilyticum sp. I15G10I2 TaxID=1892843 RepID=UPI000943B71D|nr:BMP family protein [Cellulosilyticum sp. I15G10I2]
MKKGLVKKAGLLLSMVMMMGALAGCASTPVKEEAPKVAEAAAPAVETPAEESTSPKRVALIMEGPISDMSWNATAYKGIKKIEEMGAEISYQENVPVSSLADSIRTYATEGYDVIFLATNSYKDVTLEVSKDFPETQFVIINGGVAVDNVISIQIADEEQGFMMGAIAAVATKSKQVGFVGGLEITPIINGSKGFEQGAGYVDPSVKVNIAVTGSMDDVNKAKETAKAMIEAGVDAIAPMANQSGLGVLEAAEEGKVKAIASGLGQAEMAPGALIVEVVKDTSIAYESAYQAYLDGKFGTEVIKMGAAQGVIYLAGWLPGAEGLLDEDRAKIEDVYKELAAGNISIALK